MVGVISSANFRLYRLFGGHAVDRRALARDNHHCPHAPRGRVRHRLHGERTRRDQHRHAVRVGARARRDDRRRVHVEALAVLFAQLRVKRRRQRAA